MVITEGLVYICPICADELFMHELHNKECSSCDNQFNPNEMVVRDHSCYHCGTAFKVVTGKNTELKPALCESCQTE